MPSSSFGEFLRLDNDALPDFESTSSSSSSWARFLKVFFFDGFKKVRTGHAKEQCSISYTMEKQRTMY
jgi:hypothetical protein